MKLLVGLGNPGEKYKKNRHNVGFMFIDYLVNEFLSKNLDVSAISGFDNKYDAEVAKYQSVTEEILVMKPQTFMNLSGKSVQKIMAFLKIPLPSLYIVHDDLDIPFGKVKVQIGVGPKLHNGIESVEQQLGTTSFTRVRIGIDNRGESHISGESYVLQNFTPQEQARLPRIFSSIFTELSFLKK